MSDKQTKRPREVRQSKRDYGDDDRSRQDDRPVRKEIQYKFMVVGRLGAPEVRGTDFSLGDTVKTSWGPCKILEIYWERPLLGRVLMRLLNDD